MERPSGELFEEIGVETDEAAGSELAKLELLLAPSKANTNKRSRI
jgi:hypothetical protein